MTDKPHAKRGDIWRHKKRGSKYEILHDNATLECATAPTFQNAFEDDDWIIYRNVLTGAVFVRLAEEFNDGRFERVSCGADP